MKTNGRKSYYQTLTRVGEVVDETIEEFLEQDDFGKYKRIIYGPMLEKKRGKQKLRSTLTYLSYCAFTGESPQGEIDNDLAKLMVSTEFELWSEYMTNWIFDNKGNVRNDPLIRKKTAVAIKSFLEDAVRISGQVGKEYAKMVLDSSSNVTKAFVFEFERETTNKRVFEEDYEIFLREYKENYAIPGIGKTVSLGTDLAALYSNKENCSKSKALSDIFVEYGVHLDILNALGDFIIKEGNLTTDKIASDQFADIRNGIVTLPIWFMYKRSDKEGKKFLLNLVDKESLNKNEQSKLIKILFETGAYETVSKEIKKNGRKLKKQIKDLKFGNSASSQLQQAMTVLESNKIYHFLKGNYEKVKHEILEDE
ncbi:hypothetical protein GOV13_03220 [Candidatus Pacearchaeota archaeon]|nr:hypothetical protein [Candidatus Pacearchaeota archaeon]